MAPGDRTQNLILKAKAEGFEDAQRKVRELGREVKDLNQTQQQGADGGKAPDSLKKTKEQTEGLGTAAKNTAVGVLKLALAFRALFKVLRIVPLLASIINSTLSIIETLKQELALRLKIADAMERQGRAQDTLNQKRASRKQSVERVAGQRGFGGFKTPDAARLAGSQAARAQEQFSDLSDEDVKQAVGLFGDIGLSQEDITDLAITNALGIPNVDSSKVRSRASARRIAARRLARNRERIDIFANRETKQGDGLGRAAFRDGPSERQKRVFAQAQSPSGATDDLRAFFEKRLGPGADIDRAIRLTQEFGTAQALEDARTKEFGGGARGPIAIAKRLRVEPVVEISIPDPPTFGGRLFETVTGLPSVIEDIPLAEFEQLKAAVRELRRQGTRGSGAVNITINNNQHSRNTVPGPPGPNSVNNGENRVRQSRGD